MNQQRASNLLRLALVLTTFAIAASCSGDPEPDKGKADKPPSEYSSYSIKIFAGPERKRVDLPPLAEVEFRVPFERLLDGRGQLLDNLPPKLAKALGTDKDVTAPPEGAGKTPGGKSKPQAEIGTPDGGVSINGTLRDPLGWALVYGAAYECGMGNPGAGLVDDYPQSQQPVVPPWATGAYFIFERPPAACDHQLAYQEVLTCVASKLSEVAESPAVLRWEKVPSAQPNPAMPPGPWEIFPQSAKDRFVARDLAIHTLAIAAFTDLNFRPTAAPNTFRTCATTYADAAAAVNPTPAEVANFLATAFGVNPGDPSAYFPPKSLPIDATTFSQHARSRLLFNAHVLRAGARLLRDQLPKGVYADMAGAERQRALATDPARGAKLVWGAETDADEAYNSLAHSTRLIAGRWERGVLEDAPHLPCGDVEPMETLQAGLGPEFAARATERPTRTAEQQDALRLVQSAGVVLPEAVVLQDTTASYRDAVRDQLVENAARVHGLTGADPDFTTWGQGRAVKAAFDEVSDEDLRFGLLRNLTAYQQLTTSAATTVSMATPGGGLSAATTVGSLNTAGGMALDGGIPNEDLAVDYTSRAGRISTAAQCNEFQGVFGALYSDGGYISTFQNSLFIGDTMRRRLVVVREEATRAFGDSEPASVATAGAVEVRTWSGLGRMILVPQLDDSGAATHLTLWLVGFNPEDFGVEQPAQIADALGLVFGKPWVADCAAGLRASCPSGFEGNYVARHTAATIWSDIDPFSLGLGQTWARFTGADGTLISLEFDLTAGAPSEFQPSAEAPGEIERLYVTSRYKQGSPTGVVFGSLAIRSNFGATTTVYSKFKGELIDNSLGVSALYPTTATQLGGPSTSKPPAYCIDGLDREPFVPLENELTSDGDSYEDNWAHYLALAEKSGRRADELGRELIRLGFERDLKREAAGKELAEQCGDYSALDSIEYDKAKGKVKESKTDKALNICLGESRKDVVFLSEVPPKLKTAADPTQWLKDEVLRCGGAGASNPLCSKATLEYDALDLAPYIDSGTSSGGNCDDSVAVVKSLVGGGGLDAKKLQQIAATPWFSDAALAAAISQLRIVVAETGEWSATAGGAPVMSTTDTDYWPACLPSNCNEEPAQLLDAIFRDSSTPFPPTGANGKMHLLWRVQAAVWMLGGLAGEVPAGTFTSVVPAARLFDAPWPSQSFAPTPLVYAHSRYIGGTLDPTSLGTYAPSATDSALLGTGVSVAPGFDLSLTTAPQWLKDSYLLAAGLTHFSTSNRAYRARDRAAAQAKVLGGGFAIPAGQAANWVADRAALLAGLQCAGLDGPPTSNVGGANGARRQIGNVKFSTWDCETPTPSPMWAGRTGPDGFGVGAANNIPNAGCHGDTGGTESVALVRVDCATTEPAIASKITRPELCSPSDRLALFVNAYPPLDNCRAAAQLTQAVALGCAFSQDGYRPLAASPGEITEVADIQKLERWVGDLTKLTDGAVSRLYLTGIPDRVVADFKTGAVGSGSQKGNHGKLVLELESSVRDIATGYGQLSGTLGRIRAALQQAQYGLELETLKSQVDSRQMAIARWQVHSKIVNSLARTVNFGLGDAFNPVGVSANAAAGLNDAELAKKELAALEEIDALNAKIENTNVLKTLNELDEATNTLYTDAQTSLAAVQKSTANAAQLSESLRFSEATAQYYAAVGSGADFFVDENGKVVELPVNIVLNRQYDITKRRYETALKEARYLAYIARIAIEQRLGVRLDEFTQSIGPLDAPASWAEDICVATGVDYGVNYEKLRDIDVPDGGFQDPDGGATNDAAKEFANMWIGDYVDKLQKFVEFYNMEFPAHDGDDTAVLSLRDDLLGPGGTCFVNSSNLLLYSSDLRQNHPLTTESGNVVKGWQLRRCEPQDQLCLQLEVGATLSPEPPPANQAPGSGVTWLKEVPLASITDEAIVSEIQTTPGPARLVYQTVALSTGPYVLSWWDQARDSSGGVGTAPQEYPVTVYDSTWSSLKTAVQSTHVPDATGEWKRRELTFTVAAPGDFHLAFAAGSSATVAGSVAISDVQLEMGSVASAYVPNGSSPLALTTNCAQGSASELQAAFQYRCIPGPVCFYELAAPFLVDSSNLLVSSLSGKIAADNFNYRHISTALNIVGTGVVDCSVEPTPSCYGSAYVDYTLAHSAFDVTVLSHKRPKEAQHFNFGLANINHGKALAAERFITLPIGSADGALLSQAAFEKIEFRGRPIEGNYRLRVFDKPSLRWNKVEDIQFVVKYRYWSRIQPQPSGQ